MKRNPVRHYYFIDIHIIYQNLAFVTVKFGLFNFSIPRTYIFYPFFRYAEKNNFFIVFMVLQCHAIFFLNYNFSLYLWLHLYLYNKFEFYNYFFERRNYMCFIFLFFSFIIEHFLAKLNFFSKFRCIGVGHLFYIRFCCII